MKWKSRRGRLMTFHGARAALARKSLRSWSGVVRAGRARRIEFYFHLVKVVAPPVLYWPPPPPPPPPRAYQTYAVFLILILSPYTPLRRRFYKAFRSGGTFCLETRLVPPLAFSLLVHRPSNLYLVRFPSPFNSFFLLFSSFIFFSSFFFHPVHPTTSFVFLRFRLWVWQVMYQVHRMRS